MATRIIALLCAAFHCVVHAHKGTGLDKQFGDGNRVSVPAGGKWTGNLTGDKIGIIEDELAHQRKHLPLARDQFGGKVEVKDDRYHEGPPPGSKKWVRLVAEGDLEPKKNTLKEGLDEAGIRYEDDDKKADLVNRARAELNYPVL